LNHALQTAQVARFGFDGKSWTYLAGSPCARKTGNEGGEIRWICNPLTIRTTRE
jgi:hypothetical protein